MTVARATTTGSALFFRLAARTLVTGIALLLGVSAGLAFCTALAAFFTFFATLVRSNSGVGFIILAFLVIATSIRCHVYSKCQSENYNYFVHDYGLKLVTKIMLIH